MKASTNNALIALLLKLVGVILVLISLIDYFTLLTAAKFSDNQWALAFTSQIVERGFIPLIGIALFLAGSWMEANTDSNNTVFRQTPLLRLGMLALSSLLGLLFLLAVPWNINATNGVAADEMKKLDQQLVDAEKQLDTQVQQQLDAQLGFLEQTIKGGQLQGDQLTQAQKELEKLKRFKSDPKALADQVKPQKDQKLKEISDKKKEVEEQTRGNALRTGMRIGLIGILLAIGFAFIGWTGLRQLLAER